MKKIQQFETSINIPVIQTEKFKQQSKYLCSKNSAIEWSGILFYSSEGTFPNLKITLEEIFLMDLGNAGYTSYEYDEEVVNFQMQNPDTLKMKKGHIHSHNTMATFFSGTDKEELLDNVDNHVYYLSVIVNNKGDIEGKVAAVVKSNFQTKEENSQTISLFEEDKTVIICNCVFDTFEKFDLIDKSFVERHDKIKENNKKTTQQFFSRPNFNRRYFNATENVDWFNNKKITHESKKTVLEESIKDVEENIPSEAQIEKFFNTIMDTDDWQKVINYLSKQSEYEVEIFIQNFSTIYYDKFEDYWIEKEMIDFSIIKNKTILTKTSEKLRADDTLFFWEVVTEQIIELLQFYSNKRIEDVIDQMVESLENLLTIITLEMSEKQI
jgi:hypothetical protein